MKIAIVGAGTVGFQIAKQLIAENKDVVLIEKDPDKAKHASHYLDCMVINDEGNKLEVLKKAGINKSDFFISVTDSDEVNMIACGLVASEFSVPYRIARVRNIDYFSPKILSESFLGIDYIVNPEIEAAKKIVNTIEHGAISDIILFEDTDIQMRSINVNDNSFFKNKYIQDIKRELNKNFLIAGILREEHFIIPSGSTTVKENDNLYLIASDKNLEEIFTKIGRPKTDIKKILIVGGGRIGSYVAKYFSQTEKHHMNLITKFTWALRKKRNKNIKIIEKNYNKCKLLSEEFPDVLVIHADISDEGIFEEEQLSDYDLIITTTDNEELNILGAIYAKTMGIKKSIALVNHNNYINVATKIGIDAIVSPKNSIVNPILKFVRKGNIKSVHSISHGEIEIIEGTVMGASQIVGNMIKDIKMPSNSLIVAVTREKEDIIPNGNFTINKGDDIIIITRKESITKVEEMFTS